MPKKDLLKTTVSKKSRPKSRSTTPKDSVKTAKGKNSQSKKRKSKPQDQVRQGLRYSVELELHVHQTRQKTKPPKQTVKTQELVLEKSGNVVTAGTVRIHTESKYGLHNDVMKAVSAEDMWLILRLLEIIE